jgi:isopenicillin N synthase-like dioxygenase
MSRLRLIQDFDVKIVDMESGKWPEMLAYSFRNTGFAILKNHGVDFRNIEVLYAQWAEFFASNQKYTYKSEDGNNGYIPFRSENAKGNPVKDLKEFFHVFAPFENVPNGVSRMITKRVAEDMLKIARHLLFVLQPNISNELYRLQGETIQNMVKDSKNNLLRVLHYPAIEGEVEPGAVRAAAHEDINLITLLPAATQPGLEVQDLKGNWHKIECDPGTIVVNVGDMLQEASGGVFKSTTHRVVNPEGENVARYSMPLFVHPRPECILSKKYTAGQYLDERLKEIGLK